MKQGAAPPRSAPCFGETIVYRQRHVVRQVTDAASLSFDKKARLALFQANQA